MKKKGSISDFACARNEELRRAFFDQGVYSTADEVMEKVVKTPSSRFWVDPERARDIVSRYRRDPHSIDRMIPTRREMYRTLSRRCADLEKRHPDKSMIHCMTLAVYSAAPEFYLAPSTARSIIYTSQNSSIC